MYIYILSFKIDLRLLCYNNNIPLMQLWAPPPCMGNLDMVHRPPIDVKYGMVPREGFQACPSAKLCKICRSDKLLREHVPIYLSISIFGISQYNVYMGNNNIEY